MSFWSSCVLFNPIVIYHDIITKKIDNFTILLFLQKLHITCTLPALLIFLMFFFNFYIKRIFYLIFINLINKFLKFL